MLTRSGKFIVFDVTDPSFYPGKVIPKAFQDAAENSHCCWFFQPAHWSQENGFGNSIIAERRGFPSVYSPGYESEEEALIQAEVWEAAEENYRASSQANYDSWIRQGFLTPASDLYSQSELPWEDDG